jgi:cyclopropane fatty-acyl-phospholipid synthase-like methyltransferase
MSNHETGRNSAISTEEYWSDAWKAASLPRRVVADDTSLRNTVRRAFIELLDRWLDGLRGTGAQLIELGCAQSIWLPFIVERYGLSVAGLDYSEEGCAQSRHMLSRSGVKGEIFLGDMFRPPADLQHRFQVVTSFGLLEHFTDTRAAVEASAGYVDKGGLIISVIPNMNGVPGFLTRIFDRPVYDIHVPLTLKQLSAAHRDAGLEVLDDGYLMFCHLGVASPGKSRTTRTLHGFASALSVLSWIIERAVPLPRIGFTSPYVYCVARSPS